MAMLTFRKDSRSVFQLDDGIVLFPLITRYAVDLLTRQSRSKPQRRRMNRVKRLKGFSYDADCSPNILLADDQGWCETNTASDQLVL